jgi:hypothetical protein
MISTGDLKITETSLRSCTKWRKTQRAAWSSVEKRLDKIGDIHSRNEEHIISLASEVAGLKERMRLIEEGAGRERMNTVAVRVAIIGAMAALSAAIITAVR